MTVIAHLNMSTIDQRAIDLDPVLPFEVTDVFISAASHFLLLFSTTPRTPNPTSNIICREQFVANLCFADC